MALIGPSCLAGPTKGEEDLQLEEEEGLRPLASRGKDHREGRMNQKAKKIYIASWKPQTMSKLHKFESAGPAGVACEPGESEGKEAGLKWPALLFDRPLVICQRLATA